MSQRHSGVFSSRLRHSVHTSGHSWVILMCTIFVHREAVLVPSSWNIGKYVRHFNSQVQCRSKWAKSLRFKAKRHPGGMLGDERSPPNWEALRAHKSRYGSPPLKPITEASSPDCRQTPRNLSIHSIDLDLTDRVGRREESQLCGGLGELLMEGGGLLLELLQ